MVTYRDNGRRRHGAQARERWKLEKSTVHEVGGFLLHHNRIGDTFVRKFGIFALSLI